MSILGPLKKFIDIIQYREDERRAKRDRKVPNLERHDGKEVDIPILEEPPKEIPHRCRVCGFEAPDYQFCPTCLSDTMVPIDDCENGS